ncbi:hypothetical protein [Sphingobacterium kitahiroshimense]|uniref:hypothetical protein n=1 Tax=Sphingobacterium kitahiroshimense TaxID=470446 RepID=UPI003207B62B
MSVRIIESTTTTITVLHPEKSFAVFCFTPEGSLFIDSDWGFYGHRWRGFGESFKDFLCTISDEYFINKLGINYFHDTGRQLCDSRKEALSILFNEFKKYLKKCT